VSPKAWSNTTRFTARLITILIALSTLVGRAALSARPALADGPDQGCPTDYPYGAPTVGTIQFKTFPKSGTAIPIYLDEYTPPPAFAMVAEPAIVLVHGGGWSNGCRRLLNREAVDLANLGFIVFAIDHRLSCSATDQPPPTVDQAPLCDWTWMKIDPVTRTKAAALHDVEDAVSWVRANASAYHLFDGKVAGVGGSSGGNLVYEAAAVLPAGDPRRPDAVAGWSGLTEFGAASDGAYSCDKALGGSGVVSNCWTAVVKYIGCDIRTSTDPACVLAYSDASPDVKYGSGDPPAFIANADGELVYVLDAQDFSAKLGSLGIANSLCLITNSNLHGRGYLYVRSCNAEPSPPTGSGVLNETATYLRGIVGA
jgi:acetyl esterase/lipase